jgi:cytosine/adenosine deaminase-related metal-dependent hydrolase
MSDTKLVRGRWIISDADTEVITDGSVAIREGVVVKVDAWREMREEFPEAEVIGSDRIAILPGLTNAHHHSKGVSTIQHGIKDMALEPWLLALGGTRSGDRELEVLLSAAAQLRSGVTTVVDVLSSSADAETYARLVGETLRAYDRSGMRARVAAGISTQSHIVHGAGEDERFLNSLPEKVQRYARMTLPPVDQITMEEYFDLMRSVREGYRDHPRLDLWFAPPGPQWVSDDYMAEIAARAEDWDMGIQTHGVESIYEMLHGPRSYGKPTMTHLKDLGVLSPRFSIAHGVWLTEPEIGILAQSEVSVVHNPSSNLRLRAGIAPLNALLKAGVNVAVGKDGTTLNDDEDMFTEMRMATRLHRSPVIDHPAPSAARIFDLATRGGAKLLGQDRRLGRVAPGYAADLVLIALDRITWPWIAPEVNPLDLMLYRANAGDVDTVLVGGHVVLQGGMPTRFDLPELAAELAERLEREPYPDDQAEMVSQVMPFLLDWYQGWEIPALEPWIQYNTKR